MVRVSQPMNTIDKSCYIMLYMVRVSQPMNTIVKSCYTIMWLGNTKWLLGSLCNIRIPLAPHGSLHHWRVPNKPHEYYSMYLYYVISFIYIYIHQQNMSYEL